MSLYKKYRPTKFSEMYGNEETIQILEELLKDEEQCPHAFLFTGPTGCGKTTIGRIIRRRLKCRGTDYSEIDSADFRGIDTIREIRRQMKYPPMSSKSKCRIWLLDECHQLGSVAQPALLKGLEETPDHVYFILCTTDPSKLIPELHGRCQIFEMESLPERKMMKLLRHITHEEGESLSKTIYEQIIDISEGRPRNAIQALEKVLVADEDQRLETAKKIAEEKSQAIQLARALFNHAGWKQIRTILKGMDNKDYEQVRHVVLGYCGTVLLNKDEEWAGIIMEQFIDPFYDSKFNGLIFACYSVFKQQ